MTRVAINGFGRIGRYVARLIARENNMELVAINDLAPASTLAHLLKYDSVHGRFDGTIKAAENTILLNGKKVNMYSERSPDNLPWELLNIDIVIECTGLFRTQEKAGLHLKAGAKKVILSAPSDGEGIKNVVIGINDSIISSDDRIVSNASCTTNCAAPMVKVIHELCTIESGYITTIHSYTNDQRLHDAPHSDLRRARAAAQSIIPTSTGAAKAITRIFPDLHGKLGGCGIRVPVPDGSLKDISCTVKNPVSVEEINKAFKNYAAGEMKSILEYTEEPIVSIDVIGNPNSCVFDADLTSVIGNMVKIVGWYDNEAGYSNRLVDLIKLLK